MDLPLYLQMLKALTDNGRDIQNFEEEIGMFMLKWMDQIIDGKLANFSSSDQMIHIFNLQENSLPHTWNSS